MQMINVLKRLAELDAGNSNVKNPMVEMPVNSIAEGAHGELPQLPELNDLSTLQALSGVKKLDECGPMGMMGGMGSNTPASFSINASAASGDEVAGMLTQIMNLAGVVKGQPDAGHHDGGVLTSEPEDKGFHGGDDSGSDAMRASLDKLNAIDDKPEDEGATDLALGEPGADELGTGDEGSVGGGTGDVGAMADEVRDMADQLADTDKEELGLESYDNTPDNPLTPPAFDTNKFAQNTNAGGVNKGVTNQPSAMSMTLEDQLYAEYKAFVSEGKDEFGKGKNFAKISAAAGGGEKGDRIAGAVRAEKIKKAGGKVKYAK